MSTQNFMRRYVMKCGKEGQSGFQIGNVNSATETALHISFSIEKADVTNPNDAKIQIWNLSDKSLKVLEDEDCIVELRAGYGNQMALILVGCVTSSTTTKDNADRMTELTVVDGSVELRETTVSISKNGKVDSKQIYQAIAGEMGLPIVFADDLTFKTIPNGFCFVGKARDALHKIVNYNQHSWTIQNQVIQITLQNRALEPTGFEISSSTGLIGTPKRITLESTKQTGWEVEYLLNGAIGINDAVSLKSSVANGYFRVHKLTINGDNMEGDWTCTAQLISLEADASLDAKAGGSSSGNGLTRNANDKTLKVTQIY